MPWDIQEQSPGQTRKSLGKREKRKPLSQVEGKREKGKKGKHRVSLVASRLNGTLNKFHLSKWL